jgi:5-methylthioribose kinase
MDADYEFLTESTLGRYIRQHPELVARLDPDAISETREIGDGNLNLVFHVVDRRGRGLILKQALPYVRMVGDGWPMTPERAEHEVTSLRTHHALAPDLVVEVVRYDPERHIIVLEDLSDHSVWRDALNRGERHDGAAEAIGRYVAAVAAGTSPLGLDREQLSAAVSATQNPDLCTLTDDLVFTEPVVDAGRNAVLPGNAADAADLAADPVFRAAMGEARWRFTTQAEALIHGDLHTGSVMVRAPHGTTEVDSVKAFDSEFAFYGPIAFDLGALTANYTFAAARALALGEDDRAGWALELVDRTWNSFAAETRRRAADWPDRRVWDEDFAAARLDRWRRETWLFASAKLARRIVGAAKVRDIETLEPDLRVGAARGVLRVARAASAVWESPHADGQWADLARPLLAASRAVLTH